MFHVLFTVDWRDESTWIIANMSRNHHPVSPLHPARQSVFPLTGTTGMY
jgi:hypothetical protein